MHPCGREAALSGAIKVGERECARGLIRPLPEPGNIQVEQLADEALGIHDLAVYLAGRHIDKTRGNFGQ